MARDFTSASSQYLSDAASFVVNAPMSIACWFNVDNVTARHFLMSVVNDTSGKGDRFSLQARGDQANDPLEFQVFEEGLGQDLAVIDGVTAGSWSHAGGSKASAGDTNVYLNGSVGTPDTAHQAVPSGINDCHIGGINYVTFTSYADALIAEAGVWDAVLTSAEFAMLALGYSPLFIRLQSLVAYWPLLGRTSPEIDLVGARSLTLNSAPATADHPPVFYPSTSPIISPPSSGAVYVPRPAAISVSSLGVMTV